VVAKRQTSYNISSRGRVSKKTRDFDLTLDKITEYIKTRAYYIWEEVGRPQDRDLEIWLKAEKEILSQLAKR
jgi:hypothetical protein